MTASFATIMNLWARETELVNDTEVYTSTPTTGYAAKEDALIQAMETDYPAGTTTALEGQRGLLADLLDASNIEANYDWYLLQAAKSIGSTSEDRSQMWRDLFDYFITNDQFYKSREIVFDPPAAAGANIGDGSYLRCSNDDRGMPMEGWFVDAFTAKCERAARQLGVDFEAEFRLRGSELEKDELKRTGTGLDETLKCVSERNSETYVLNPGFETFGGTVPTAGTQQTPSDLSGWTPTSGDFSNLEVSVDQLYRTPPGSDTSISLNFTDNETISQNLVTVNGTTIDVDTPYHVQVSVYRDSSCDGSLVLTLGGVTRTVPMSGLADDAWNVVTLVATAGISNWSASFEANDLTLSFQLTGRTTGTMYLDTIIFAPFTQIAGGASVGRGAMGNHMVMVEGRTAFIVGDSWSFTDTQSATRGINQYVAAMGDFGYMPSTAAGYETIADRT